MCKAMESLIREQVMNHLCRNGLICRQQHGFMKGRSCTTQLLDVLDTWTEIIDDGGSVDAIYMDFMKAFDTVPHRRLLSKLEAHGVRGKVLKWVQGFLMGRQQWVVVNGARSKNSAVTSGIPQGSVIGPMLFTVYINDLPSVCSSEVRLFADDTKLFNRSDQPSANTTLQEDLNRLQQWSDEWLLRFHPDKCSVLKMGKKKSAATYTMRGKKNGKEYSIELEEHATEKDLGVFIDNQLSFKEHVAKVTAKANRVVGVIRRTFDYLDDDLFVNLFKSLVRPILEYGHSVYQPHLKSLCSDIEDVQRRATKLLPSVRDMPYPERLRHLGLPSLEHRRNRGDMIDMYKYMHGLYDVDRPSFQLLSESNTRGHSLKIQKSHSRLNVRSGFFSQRVVSTWNGLPNRVVTAPTLNCFKSRLDVHWQNDPGLFDPTCIQ